MLKSKRPKEEEEKKEKKWYQMVSPGRQKEVMKSCFFIFMDTVFFSWKTSNQKLPNFDTALYYWTMIEKEENSEKIVQWTPI